MTAARLIALDWGTSSLRAYLLGAGGTVLEARQQPWGILHLPDGGFAAALRGVAGDWLESKPASPPLIASGMVGSAQGWREVPYVPCPADASALAAGLLEFEAWPGVRLHLVPGMRVGGERPDVMRGEETQALGVLARDPSLSTGPATLLLPGTHSKWVRLDAGRIVDLHTYLTGELYALLAQHSILGRPAREAAGRAASDAAFERGVQALHAPDAVGVAPLLFSVRSLVLGGQLAAADSLEYLSGLLVGDELRCAFAMERAGTAPVLVGDAALCGRYRRALSVFGIGATVAAADAAPAGLWHIASRAGLLLAT